MRVHVLQHVPFEGLASIAPWLEARGATITCTRFFEDPRLPAASDVDFVIAMGGPMSVNDEAELPWLIAEKQFVREAIQAGAAVLGICLGAQLIASALGAAVRPGREREIGWFELEGVPSPDGAFQFPAREVVFHWHGETFDLPPGAVHLARTPGCENQAYQLGDRVIGLQFHLETTPESLDQITTHCRNELVPSTYVQTEEALRAAPPEAYARINALMHAILEHLTKMKR